MSPLKAAILAASPTDLIFADLSSTASPDVAGRVARPLIATHASAYHGTLALHIHRSCSEGEGRSDSGLEEG